MEIETKLISWWKKIMAQYRNSCNIVALQDIKIKINLKMKKLLSSATNNERIFTCKTERINRNFLKIITARTQSLTREQFSSKVFSVSRFLSRFSNEVITC